MERRVSVWVGYWPTTAPTTNELRITTKLVVHNSDSQASIDLPHHLRDRKNKYAHARGKRIYSEREEWSLEISAGVHLPQGVLLKSLSKETSLKFDSSDAVY